MVLTAQSECQLLEDLSTMVWLLTALGVIVNLMKSMLVPYRQLKFLEFLIDTQTMTIALPLTKIADLQKEAAMLLKLHPELWHTLWGS